MLLLTTGLDSLELEGSNSDQIKQPYYQRVPRSFPTWTRPCPTPPTRSCRCRCCPSCSTWTRPPCTAASCLVISEFVVKIKLGENFLPEFQRSWRSSCRSERRASNDSTLCARTNVNEGARALGLPEFRESWFATSSQLAQFRVFWRCFEWERVPQ